MKFSGDPEALRRWERSTELPYLILSVVYLVLLLVPNLFPGLDPRAAQLLISLSWLVWAAFAFDLLVRVTLAPRRLVYLRTHWLDVLIVVFPFLRPLRLVGILFLLIRTWRRSRVALGTQTLSFVGVASLIVVFVGAALVFLAERQADGPIQTLDDALWWAITTITTVGYGDTYPVTDVGRGVAALLMLVGITAFGLITASIATLFQAAPDAQEITERQQLLEVTERLERMERLLEELRRDRGGS